MALKYETNVEFGVECARRVYQEVLGCGNNSALLRIRKIRVCKPGKKRKRRTILYDSCEPRRPLPPGPTDKGQHFQDFDGLRGVNLGYDKP